MICSHPSISLFGLYTPPKSQPHINIFSLYLFFIFLHYVSCFFYVLVSPSSVLYCWSHSPVIYFPSLLRVSFATGGILIPPNCATKQTLVPFCIRVSVLFCSLVCSQQYPSNLTTIKRPLKLDTHEKRSPQESPAKENSRPIIYKRSVYTHTHTPKADERQGAEICCQEACVLQFPAT